MAIACGRQGRMISVDECADIIVHTSVSSNLRVCNECEHGKSLQFTAPGSASHAPTPAALIPEAPTPKAPMVPDIAVYTDAQLWTELHRRHPQLWKNL